MVSRCVLFASVLLLCVAGACALSDPARGGAGVGSLQPSPAGAAKLPGEGEKCGLGPAKLGTCTSRGCRGGVIAKGLCPGPASVQCCLPISTSSAVLTAPTKPTRPGRPGSPAKPSPPGQPQIAKPVGPNSPAAPGAPSNLTGPQSPSKSLQLSDPVRSGAAKFPGTELAFPWPAEYTFPYATGRYVVSDFSLQRIRLYDGATMVKEWKMSSGKLGIGFANDVAASPAGKFKIFGKVGQGAPLGMIFEKQRSLGRIGKASDKFAHMQTRLLLLEGLDQKNRNTRARSIYIHGTNRAAFLGTRQSHGCFRMADADVAELESLITVPTFYWAVPFNAWP